MNAVGFATTYSLVDLLDDLPLPEALNIKDNDRLATDSLDIQNVQELQDIAAVIAPAIQMARLPSDLDKLRFKDQAHSFAPNMRHHHAQATPLMSLLVTHHQQFQDIISVPPYQLPPPAPRPIQQPIQQPGHLQPGHPRPVHQQAGHPQHGHPQPVPQFQPQPPPPTQARPVYPNPQYAPLPHNAPQPHHVHHQPMPISQPIPQPHTQPLPPPQARVHYPSPHHVPAPSHPQYPPAHNIPPPHLYQDQPMPNYIKQEPVKQRVRQPKTPAVKRKTEQERMREREKKALKSEIMIDTRNSSLEEVLEKFLQDTINEQMGAIADGGLLCNFNPKQLLQLVAITAKLKRKNRTKNVNLSKLTSLLTTLSSQLQVQTEVLKNTSYKDESQVNSIDDDESDQTRLQKFEICCDCAVTALNIMTSNDMDSRVYLEECVEAIITFVNTALTIISDVAFGNSCSSPKKSSSKSQSDRRSFKSVLFAKQSLSKLNAKCSEVLALVNDLLLCRTEATLNDSLLLSTSRAALTAFFLMDSSTTSNELQLNALNVITAIFASYKNHQTVILEELIHSIARLPTTKRNRVQYQIGANNSESISIFSALIMKLIQSLFNIKRNSLSEENKSNPPQPSQEDLNDVSDYERVLKNQYNSALRASYAFLSSFLRRCCGVDKKDDCDYRVLFETFVDDLMTCLYKPDWSSAQLITHVLIKLLISNINPQPGKKNPQSTNQTLKLASLEHLGTICARLIKERSLLPKYRDEVLRALSTLGISFDIIRRSERNKKSKSKHSVKRETNLEDSETEEDENEDNKSDNQEDDGIEVGILPRDDEDKFWIALLTFCQREKSITKCGRNIFCAIWLKELERRAKHEYEINNPVSHEEDQFSDDDESNGPQMNNMIKQYSRNNGEQVKKTINGPSAEDIQARLVSDYFRILSIAAKRSAVKASDLDASTNETNEASTIDESTAATIIKLLDVSLSTTQKLIDAALSHIVAALSTTANTNIRSRAMKSLSHILNNAPKDCATKLLARDDLQKAIGASLLDQSTSVRESTVELIGRFILNSQSEALIDKYYDMLTGRIMDSGVSVRKRVIKILREICIGYPSYARVPEICSIIIKRINDEGEGIRKLVSETFTSMWFKEERTHEAIVAKVACITHVVATVWSKILAEANKSTGTESHFEWLHQLLSSLLKAKDATDQTNHVPKRKSRVSETEPTEDGETLPPEVLNLKQTLSASTQIISVLVSEKLSNGSQESNSRADCLAAMTALWSFAKISPLLLTHYLDLFQSFLSIDPKSSFDLLILEKVIQIIELILPSISNPSVTTMNSIETHLAKLIIRGSIRVISVSVSCLSELIHRHSHNQQLANDTFKRFLKIIRSYRANPDTFDQNQHAHFLRALYTCGLLAKHFNVDDRDVLYAELIHFVGTGINQRNQHHNAYEMPGRRLQDERVLLRSLEGLGFMFEKTPSLMLKEATTRIYRFFMRSAIDLGPNDSAVASSCVLTNLRNYLQDEVNQEMKSASSIDWSRENLKEMTSSKQEDANSVQSSVIQLYLRDMLSCALSSNVDIRKAAIRLIHSVHNGGHINPLSIVPSLIALSSDDDANIRLRADHVLQEIERKYNNFVNMKSKQGVLESFILNRRKRGFHRLDLERQQQASQGISTDVQTETPAPEIQGGTDHINVTAKLSTLYSVVATNRQQRRAFINSLLRYFDIQTLASAPNMLSSDPNESRFVLSKCIGADILRYVNDNLIFLPFTLLDEPLFLIHQIGITLSNLVSQAVSHFREILQLSSIEDEEAEDIEGIEVNEGDLSQDSSNDEATDEEEDPEHRRQRKLLEKQNRVRQRKMEIRQRKLQQNLIGLMESQDDQNETDDYPVSILQVRDLVSTLHRCILLMHCRKVIWDLYGITEQKFEDYTPNESTKVTDKPTHRRNLDESTFESIINTPNTTVHFESEPFMRSVYSEIFGFEDDLETSRQLEHFAPNRHKLKLEYRRFSQLMTK